MSNQLLPYQSRAVNEKKDLDAKIAALELFIASPTQFGSLPEDEQGRMREQCHYMGMYSFVLGQRIAAWSRL